MAVDGDRYGGVFRGQRKTEFKHDRVKNLFQKGFTPRRIAV